MYNQVTLSTALPGRLFLCLKIAVYYVRLPKVSVQAIKRPLKGGQLMYYHTCLCCGSNLDLDDCCNCLFHILGKAPKWSGMDGVRTRSPQEVCPCPHLSSAVCLTVSAFFRWPRRAAALSLCGRARSLERRCQLPGDISRICSTWGAPRG